MQDSLPAYQLAKRGNSLRVVAEVVRWGERCARINTISPGIVITPLARAELGGLRLTELSSSGISTWGGSAWPNCEWL